MKVIVFPVILACFFWSCLILPPSARAMDEGQRKGLSSHKRSREEINNPELFLKRIKTEPEECPTETFSVEARSSSSSLSSSEIQSWKQYAELRTNVPLSQWRQRALGPGFEKEMEPQWDLSALSADKLLPEEILYRAYIFYERVRAQNLFRFGSSLNFIPVESSAALMETVISHFNRTALEDPGSANLFSVLRILPPYYIEEVTRKASSFSPLALWYSTFFLLKEKNNQNFDSYVFSILCSLIINSRFLSKDEIITVIQHEGFNELKNVPNLSAHLARNIQCALYTTEQDKILSDTCFLLSYDISAFLRAPNYSFSTNFIYSRTTDVVDASVQSQTAPTPFSVAVVPPQHTEAREKSDVRTNILQLKSVITRKQGMINHNNSY